MTSQFCQFWLAPVLYPLQTPTSVPILHDEQICSVTVRKLVSNGCAAADMSGILTTRIDLSSMPSESLSPQQDLRQIIALSLLSDLRTLVPEAWSLEVHIFCIKWGIPPAIFTQTNPKFIRVDIYFLQPSTSYITRHMQPVLIVSFTTRCDCLVLMSFL